MKKRTNGLERINVHAMPGQAGMTRPDRFANQLSADKR